MSRRWPRGRPRILVTDCWLPNAGDAAIAVALDRVLRGLVPGAAVLHAAYGVELLGDRYPELDLVPPLDALLGVQGARPLPPEWSARAAAAIAAGADVVISQGGGFLFEAYQPWTRIAAHADIVRRGVPLLLVAQSISPFDAAAWRTLLRFVLSRAELVTVRDAQSVANAMELGAGSERVTLVGDLALTLFPEPPPPPSARGVALILSTHRADVRGTSAADRRRVSLRIVRQVLDLVGDEAITVCSTVQGLGAHGLEDDGDTADAVLEQLTAEERGRIDVRRGSLIWPDVVRIVGDQRAVVTQRLHPGLFALGLGIPTALLVGRKLDVLHGVGLRAGLGVDPDAPDEIDVAVRAALDPTATRGPALWGRLEPARHAAARNQAEIGSTLRRLGWPVSTT